MPAPTVTSKHLAYALVEQHQLTKKQGVANAGRACRHDHQAPEERRAGEDRRPRNSASAHSALPAWAAILRPASRFDQGQQKGRLPRDQGTQGGGLITAAENHARPD